jgi:Holliday junction resolvase RusA-like endonuclease
MVEITIPDVPPSLNKQGRHWGKAFRLKRAWKDYLWGYIRLLGTAPLSKLRALADVKTKMRVEIEIYSESERDEDNLRYCEKIIYDAMQQLGILYNDSPEFVERKLTWEKTPKKSRRTVIRIGVA